MSIYISSRAPDLSKSDVEFRLKGLVGRRCSPSQASTYIQNTFVTPGFDNIRNNVLYYAIAGTLSENVDKPFIFVGQPLSSFKMANRTDLPLMIPNVVFSLPAVTPEIEAEVGAKRSYARGKGQQIYMVSKPTLDNLKRIAQYKDVKFNVSQAGFASINGARGLILVRKFLALFLEKVDHYQKAENKFSGMDFDGEFADVVGKRKFQVSRLDETDTVDERKKRKTSEDDEGSVPPQRTITEAYPAIGFTKKLKQVQYICTTPEQLVKAPGLLFPYFARMCGADIVGVMNFISEYCYPLLGETDEQRASFFNNLKDDLEMALGTEEGQQLGHMVKGFQMAMKGECRMQLVILGQKYYGFALMGENFTVNTGSKLVRPLPYDVVLEEASKLNAHLRALAELKDILDELELDSGGKEAVDIDTWVCNRDVWNSAQERSDEIDRMSDEMKRKMRGIADAISFDDEPAVVEVTVESIAAAILHMRDRTQWDRQTHMWLRDDCLTDMRLEVGVLGAFGRTAPSFWLETESKKIKMSIPNSPEPLFLIKEVVVGMVDGKPTKERRAELEMLYQYRPTVVNAALDWQKIISTGSVRQPAVRKTRKELREYKVYQGVELVKVWDCLRELHKETAEEKVPEKEAVMVGSVISKAMEAPSGLFDF